MMKKTMLNSKSVSCSIFILFFSKILFLLLVLLSPPSSAAAQELDLKSLLPQCPFTKLVSFGDSFTDTGNAKLLGGLISFAKALIAGSPYGSTFFKDKPSNRLCDGRLVIDFLAETLRLPSFIPPYKDTSANFTFGVNFAIAGSTSLPGDFFSLNRVGRTLPWKDIPDSIQTQIDWFTEFMNGEYGSAYKAEMNNVLFWIGEMGGNDYLRTFGHSLKVETLTQMAVDHVCKVLKTCLDNGAKFIVVQALPPSGCSPLDMLLAPPYDRDMMGCAGSANAVIQAHNRLLQQKLKEYEKQYPDCMILYADYWGAYQAILENPILYGFQEPFKACCGTGGGLFNFDLHSICGSAGTAKCADPSKFINWDGVHLTEAMYKKISELFFTKDYCKPSFSDLISRRLSFGSGGGGVSGSQQGQGQQSGQAGGGAQQSGDDNSGNQGQQSAQGKTDGGAQQTASGSSSVAGSQGQGDQQSAQNKTGGGAQQSASGGAASSGSQGQQSAEENKGGAQQSGSGAASSSQSGSQGQGQQQSPQNKADGGGGAQQSSQNNAGGSGSAQQQSGSSSSGAAAAPTSGSQGQGQQSTQNKGEGGAQQPGKSDGSHESSSSTSSSSSSSYEYKLQTGGGGAQQSGGSSGGKSDEMHFKGQKTFQYKTEDGMNVSCSCTYS